MLILTVDVEREWSRVGPRQRPRWEEVRWTLLDAMRVIPHTRTNSVVHDETRVRLYPRSRSRSFAISARRTTTGPVETHRGGRNRAPLPILDVVPRARCGERIPYTANSKIHWLQTQVSTEDQHVYPVEIHGAVRREKCRGPSHPSFGRPGIAAQAPARLLTYDEGRGM